MVGSDLEVHEHDPWVFHSVLDCPIECEYQYECLFECNPRDPPKESDSLTTINQAVIISESNVHHRPDHDLQCKRLWMKDEEDR